MNSKRAYWLADKIPEAAMLLCQQADKIDRLDGECEIHAKEVHRLSERELVLEEALKRLHDFGGTNGTWNSGIVFQVNDWIAGGMVGPLPELPAFVANRPCAASRLVTNTKGNGMITKYVIRPMHRVAEIREVEVLRETDASVFVQTNRKGDEKGRREAKVSSYEQYHDTWEIAHAALLRLAEDGVALARRRLETANGFHGNVKGMRKPANDQAKGPGGDKLEIAIVELINALGGTTILDKIISGLYHTTGERHQRNTLTARLYRMSRKGLVFSVPKKKGVYTTTRPEGPIEEEDRPQE